MCRKLLPQSQTTNDWRMSCDIEEADIKSAMSHSREDAPPLSGDSAVEKDVKAFEIDDHMGFVIIGNY